MFLDTIAHCLCLSTKLFHSLGPYSQASSSEVVVLPCGVRTRIKTALSGHTLGLTFVISLAIGIGIRFKLIFALGFDRHAMGILFVISLAIGIKVKVEVRLVKAVGVDSSATAALCLLFIFSISALEIVKPNERPFRTYLSL